jgi:hypothetical protein
MGRQRDRRRANVALTLLVYAIVIAAAFAVGSSGWPGRAAAAIGAWLADDDRVELSGPVGDAVREAL